MHYNFVMGWGGVGQVVSFGNCLTLPACLLFSYIIIFIFGSIFGQPLHFLMNVISVEISVSWLNYFMKEKPVPALNPLRTQQCLY